MRESFLPIIGRENVSRIVPHKDDMLLLDNIISFSAGSLTAEAVITSSSPFFSEGKVPSYISFELIAQAISAYSYLKGLKNGDEPYIGFILRVSDFQFSSPYFVENDTVIIEVKEDCAVDESLYSFAGTVRKNGEIVASGRLLVMCSDGAVVYSDH